MFGESGADEDVAVIGVLRQNEGARVEVHGEVAYLRLSDT